MAKIIPIDVIKGIRGKYGSNSSDYFATNTSSNKIRLAKLANPYQGPPSEKQLAQQSKFAARQAVATAWLNANKPSETNGEKGTEAYVYVQKLKRQFAFSNVTQVLYKYMNSSNEIVLPDGANDSTPSGGGKPSGGGSTPSGGGGSNTGGGGTNPGGSGSSGGGGSVSGGGEEGPSVEPE